MDLAGSILDIGSLNCVYFAMLAVGVMYALVILITGGMHDFGGDVHLDLNTGGHFDLSGGDAMSGSVDVTNVSPVTLAGFVTAFGAFGLIAQSLFNTSGAASLVWASVGGVLVGLVSHLAFIYFFIKPQGSSEVTRADVVGATAEVITPIPSGNVGEIALVAQGARVTMMARGRAQGAIARGTVVRIQDVVGSVAMVEPLPSESAVKGTDG